MGNFTMKIRKTNWQPYRIGFAIVSVVLSAIFSIVILLSSNNRPVDSWLHVRPTVLLAICTVVANLAIHQVLSEGLPIRWWVEAKHRNGSADDLKRVYDHGSSAWSAICSFFTAKPSTAAIACLAAAAVAINGPLLQRASRVDNLPYTTNVQIKTSLAAEWPLGFSGLTNARHAAYWLEPVQAFTPGFASVVRDFSARKDIALNSTGCVGTCTTTIKGAGFALDCTQGSYDYNITVDSTLGHAVYVEAVGFSTAVNLITPEDIKKSATIGISTLFKNLKDSEGKGITRNCTLIPSIVNYSVKMENSTVNLVGTIRDDKVIKPSTIIESALAGQATLGGLVFVGQQKYDSTAEMQWQGSRQWSIPMNGSLAYEFQNLGQWSPGTSELGISYAMTWSDPTETIIQGMRELMFRSAILTGDSTLPPAVSEGSMSNIHQVYKTDFLFMGLGVAMIVVGILGMIPLLWGGWILREDVSLDPIDVVSWVTALASRANECEFPVYKTTEYTRVQVEGPFGEDRSPT